MISRRHLLSGATAAGFGLGAGGFGFAQSFPARPIKAVLPYTAGSPKGVIARLFATPLSARVEQALAIANRAGGGTTIGMEAVMAADPDGDTLLVTNTTTHVIAQL